MTPDSIFVVVLLLIESLFHLDLHKCFIWLRQNKKKNLHVCQTMFLFEHGILVSSACGLLLLDYWLRVGFAWWRAGWLQAGFLVWHISWSSLVGRLLGGEGTGYQNIYML